jgi:hypothetical protein
MEGMKRSRKIALVSILGLLVAAGVLILSQVFVKTVVEYHDPVLPADEVFADDPVPKAPPPFDPGLVDSRKLGDWEVNSSAAVIRLDLRPIRPGKEAHLRKIYPTYNRAVDFGGKEVIPSVNLLDSKCKQFDDALYAAVDLAAFNGVKGRLTGLKDILKRLRKKLTGKAADYIDVALHLSGKPSVPMTRSRSSSAQVMLDAFLADEVASRPIGFYTWSKELQALYRTERFLALEFAPPGDVTVPEALAKALRSDPGLLADYKKFVGLFRKLTNPFACLSLDQLPEAKLTPAVLAAEAKKRSVRRATVSFLPPSTCREDELVARLGTAVDLMRALIKRIRSGEVDLTPRKDAGWYEHQVYALETLLLPGRGQERGKLIYSARYKQRMLESFKATVTRRRETHVRQLPPAKSAKPAFPTGISPRLRVEPAPTYYLRTARAYAFVGNLLNSVFGVELEDMYGQRETWSYGQIRERKLGERDDDFATELTFMRRLFYGLYLVSCEDVGLKPSFAAGEKVDVAACKQAALNWVASFRRDPDLKPDARVCVPVVNAQGIVTFWSVVGVRLARLQAEYVHPPSLRPAGGKWEPAAGKSLAKSDYLIPVDAFASFKLTGGVLTRKEFWDALGAAGSRKCFLKMAGKAGNRKRLLELAAEKIAAQRDEEE